MLSVREVITPSTQKRLLHVLRVRAAKQGCDAVILGGTDNTTRLSLLTWDSTTTDYGYYAACIVYLDRVNEYNSASLSVQTRP